jgi:serine protease AprX
MRRAVIALSIATATAVGLPLASADQGSSNNSGPGSASSKSKGKPTLTPMWADPLASAPASPVTPLASLDQVEQVIGAQDAWGDGATGQGVDVALIDTGVTPVQGLDGPNKLIYGPDLSFDSQNPATAYLDGYGHGTAMAGLIAGDDGQGFKGVAPKSRILSVKVGASNGATDVSQIIAAIDWVVQHKNSDGLNVRVLNLSLGTDSSQLYLFDPLAHAAEVAWRHGIVVVAAVGNDGTTNRLVADPAVDPYVMAVGADDPMGTINDSDDVVPSFSSRGNILRHADVVAPGVSVVSLRDPGSTLDTAFPNARIGDRFFRGSGTSQATALVSGAAADLISQRPGLTPDQVKALLMRTADDLNDTSKRYAGSGLISLDDAASHRAPDADQNWPISWGGGSLEGSRGSAHISIGSDTLSGEQDVMGNPYDAGSQARLEERNQAWSGGSWNSATWSGNNWSSVTWSGNTWSSATWSGNNWSSATWSSATWSSATWSSATWSSATWSSATWSGSSWSGTSWS